MIIPSGIATDHSTRDFFAFLAEGGRLQNLFGFENEDRVFLSVHHAFKFCLLTAAGARIDRGAEFLWYARKASDVHDSARRFSLDHGDISLFNPNTKTCPVFRSSRDARVNRGIYQRVPVLWREGPPEVNSWHLKFRQGLFNMSSDSGLFRTADQLLSAGAKPSENRYTVGDEIFLPLYESKMVHLYDHRFGTYEGQTEAQAAMSKLPEVSTQEHNDPDFTTFPRYWVSAAAVDVRLEGRGDGKWLIGWRDITNTTNQRTLIACALPKAAVGDTFLLLFPENEFLGLSACLLANLSSFVMDYTARQKVGGTHLKNNIIKQLPALPPHAYDSGCAWDSDDTLSSWVTKRVIELQYTSSQLAMFAEDCGYCGPPFQWNEKRRLQLVCELDAAYFHLYGVDRDDTDYILDTFPLVRKKEEKAHGHYRTKDTILNIYDQLQHAITTGTSYVSPLDPPPCDSRAAHPAVKEALPS